MKLKRSMERRKFLRDSAALLGGSSLLRDGFRSRGLERGGGSNGPEGRLTLPLNGEWEIEDSVEADRIPTAFHHTVPVPGLAHLAKPDFLDVDMFDSREAVGNLIRFKGRPESLWGEVGEDGPGVSRQQRNYFWYRKTFRVAARKESAILRINKAQFGTAVWLNGKKLGEHLGCFSAGYFNASAALDWEGENTLLVRVGAHPAVLPKGAPAGTDFEKMKWTPGIYDTVSLLLSDNPVIESLQIAPRIDTSEIEVQVVVRNDSDAPRRFALTHQINTWKGEQEIAKSTPQHLQLQPKEKKTWTQKIPVPGATLWTPENPVLYTLETSTGGDSVVTRFGMREFHFDTATKRAYLNGKVYFLRGSNITLHRFFEDPKASSLPWNEKWVRKLLVDIPKEMHWNSFRFCIGPVPDQWLDIADEAGLLIENEFFVWTGAPSWSSKYKGRRYDVEETIRQYGEWMRDNWNHPSVAIWNANNETLDDVFGDKIIPAVRSLDLSDRPWGNSYNAPVGPNDPVDDHPYLFFDAMFDPSKSFDMTELEKMSGLSENSARPPQAHAMINNEYFWLVLNRDGSPTAITTSIFDRLLGSHNTAQQRFALSAYIQGGMTEFWRAYRNYAGILHFVYLTCSYPGIVTSDSLLDVEKIELEPNFKDYMSQAFKPLGVYINFWQPTIDAGSKRRIFVMMINDEYGEAKGNLALSLEGEDGKEVLRRELAFAIPALGQQTYRFDVDLLVKPGNYLLKATASQVGERSAGPTVSRRKVSVKSS